MRNHIRTCLTRLAALALAALVGLTAVPMQASASLNPMVRVGLNYGSSALATANLENKVGSGYRFGFYDPDGTFTALAETDETQITMMKDHTLYLSGGRYYETKTAAAYTVIGAYHLQLDKTFATYNEALAQAQALPDGFVAYCSGLYRVRFGSYATNSVVTDAARDQEAVALTDGSLCPVFAATSSQYGVTVVKTGTTKILFEYDMGAGSWLGVSPTADSGQTPTTWFKGYLYYGGFLYGRLTGGDLTVVNLVDQEAYVAGVVCREMSVSWPIEALKAGACAARTFCQRSSKHDNQGFDVCASTCCQVYGGVYQAGDPAKAEQAARETAGQVIRYDGRLIEALYYSSNGGAVEAAVNAWGVSYGYLTAKYDPFECQTNTSNTYWAYAYTRAQLTSLLRSYGYDCAAVTDVQVTEYTSIGNANKLVFTDANGKTYAFTRDSVRLFEDSANGKYFSRKYTIIAPHSTGTFLKVTAQETEPSAGRRSTGPVPASRDDAGAAIDFGAAPSSGGYYLYDGSAITQTDTLYVMTAGGLVLWDPGSDVNFGGGTSAPGSDDSQQAPSEEPESEEPEEATSPEESAILPAPEGYPEANLEYITVENDSDNYLIVGSGWGHNIGMSQFGAKAMAELGYTYDQILKFYYTGVTVG